MPNRNLCYFQKILRPIPPDKKSKVGKQEDFITKETSSNFDFDLTIRPTFDQAKIKKK